MVSRDISGHLRPFQGWFCFLTAKKSIFKHSSLLLGFFSLLVALNAILAIFTSSWQDSDPSKDSRGRLRLHSTPPSLFSTEFCSEKGFQGKYKRSFVLPAASWAKFWQNKGRIPNFPFTFPVWDPLGIVLASRYRLEESLVCTGTRDEIKEENWAPFVLYQQQKTAAAEQFFLSLYVNIEKGCEKNSINFLGENSEFFCSFHFCVFFSFFFLSVACVLVYK